MSFVGLILAAIMALGLVLVYGPPNDVVLFVVDIVAILAYFVFSFSISLIEKAERDFPD